jgi:ABC-type sugar transport system ATPase subunit
MICLRKVGHLRNSSDEADSADDVGWPLMTEFPTLSAIGLQKAFGSTRALQGADLELKAGKILSLLGENGSGKSTLAKILAGVHTADLGKIHRNGTEIKIDDPASARALGVAMVFQELSLAPDLDAVDNMFLGRERRGLLAGLFDRKGEERDCRAMFDQLGLTLDLRRPIRGLGMAQKQMLEIAKALSQQPAILILDEPTASLTRREIEQLFTLVKRLRDAGTAILYVTHHLREVLEIADHVSIMRDGRVVANREVTPETTEADLVGLLIGKASGLPPAATVKSSSMPLLEVSDLRTSRSRNVSFHIGDGEIVGVYGVVGCGREDISRALVGLHPVLGGTVKLSGRTYKARDPRHALAAGMGFLPSDRKQEGILPGRPIRENLTLSNLRPTARGGVILPKRERTTAVQQLKALGVKFASAEHAITTLSGGNQQKVLFGRALAARPKLLVLEDPTAGIDIGAKQDLYRIIRDHRANGMSFLWISSDLTETLTMCDRIYAMYDGCIVSEIAAPTMADEEHLLAAVLGRGRAAQHT